jgi:hypothetical protein
MKKLFLALLLLCAPVDAAVTPGTVTTLTTTSCNPTCTEAYANPGGSNTAIFVVVHTEGINVTGVTYNGVALTFIIARDNVAGGGNVWVEGYYILNPASGSNNIVVTLASNAAARTNIIPATGVKQTAGTIIDSDSNASSNASSSSLTLDSEVGGYLFDAITQENSGSGQTPGAGQTEIWDLTTNPTRDMFGSSEPGASPTVVMSYSGLGAFIDFAHIAFSVAAAPSAFPIDYYSKMMNQ